MGTLWPPASSPCQQDRAGNKMKKEKKDTKEMSQINRRQKQKGPLADETLRFTANTLNPPQPLKFFFFLTVPVLTDDTSQQRFKL